MARPGRMDKTDWGKVRKGAYISLSGATAIFITQSIIEIDWGKWSPYAVAFASVIANLLNRFTNSTNYGPAPYYWDNPAPPPPDVPLKDM